MSISSLVLTDGTTTATLTDGTNYALNLGGWAPEVADLRTNVLGGFGPYEDVTEMIEIDVTGATLSALLANVAKLRTLLTQARRWNDGEPGVTAVVLQITMTGGSAYEATVLGGELELPRSYGDKLVSLELERVRLTVVRRGAWLAAAESPASSSSTSVGNVFTITLGSTHNRLSPIRFVWTAPISARNQASGPLILCASASDLAVVEMEAFTPGTGMATVTPASTTVARGASAMRFTTPTPATTSGGLGLAYASLPALLKSGPAQIDVYMVGSRGGASQLYQLIWQYYGAADAGVRTSATVSIPGDAGLPGFARYAGTIDVPESGITNLGLTIYGATAGDQLVMDYCVFVARKPTTMVLLPELFAWSDAFGSGNALQGVWDAIQTTYPDPLVAVERTSGGTTRAPIPAIGDRWAGAYGGTLAGIWMGIEGLGAYRIPATSGGTTPLAVTFTATRRKAYLVPE